MESISRNSAKRARKSHLVRNEDFRLFCRGKNVYGVVKLICGYVVTHSTAVRLIPKVLQTFGPLVMKLAKNHFWQLCKIGSRASFRTQLRLKRRRSNSETNYTHTSKRRGDRAPAPSGKNPPSTPLAKFATRWNVLNCNSL